jgi:glycosyltransferase involved in cell wall biosynthesis
MKNKKIAVFAADFGMNTNPSLMALFNAFLQEGASLDFYCSDNPKGQSPNTVLKEKFGLYRFPYYLNLDDSSIRSLVRSLLKCTEIAHIHAWYRMKKTDYDLVIGIDDFGLTAGYRLAHKNNCALVFLSYEILFSNEITSNAEERLKNKAKNAASLIKLVIVQDSIRGNHLIEQNDLRGLPFLYLPVSPTASVKKAEISHYLRKKFKIPAGKIILLHSGSFAEWTAAPELIAALPALGNDIVLVVHTRWNAKIRSNQFIDQIKQLNLPNVVLSLDALDESEYEAMVASADIGLVLYTHSNISKNISNIGFASGKFASYARSALPMITWNHAFYEDLFLSYKCGVDVCDLSEISEAARTITGHYGSYSCESARLFSEKLDFNCYWPAIKTTLMDLMNKQPSKID